MQSNNDENLDSTTPSKSRIDCKSNVIDVIALLKQYNRSQIDKILCTQKTVAESTSALNTPNDDIQCSGRLDKVNCGVYRRFFVHDFRVLFSSLLPNSRSNRIVNKYIRCYFIFAWGGNSVEQWHILS